MIKLERPGTFRNGLRPVCLPEKFKDADSLNEKPTIIGWDREGNSREFLKETTVSLVNNTICHRKYESLGKNIDSSQICADENLVSWRFLSGNPLLTTELNNGKWAVIGITSTTPWTYTPDNLVIYTRVDHYLDWIESYTKICNTNGSYGKTCESKFLA